jgi:hypothetical protein
LIRLSPAQPSANEHSTVRYQVGRARRRRPAPDRALRVPGFAAAQLLGPAWPADPSQRRCSAAVALHRSKAVAQLHGVLVHRRLARRAAAAGPAGSRDRAITGHRSRYPRATARSAQPVHRWIWTSPGGRSRLGRSCRHVGRLAWLYRSPAATHFVEDQATPAAVAPGSIGTANASPPDRLHRLHAALAILTKCCCPVRGSAISAPPAPAPRRPRRPVPGHQCRAPWPQLRR